MFIYEKIFMRHCYSEVIIIIKGHSLRRIAIPKYGNISIITPHRNPKHIKCDVDVDTNVIHVNCFCMFLHVTCTTTTLCRCDKCELHANVAAWRMYAQPDCPALHTHPLPCCRCGPPHPSEPSFK